MLDLSIAMLNYQMVSCKKTSESTDWIIGLLDHIHHDSYHKKSHHWLHNCNMSAHVLLLIHAYSTTQQLINRAMKIMKQRSVASVPGVHEHLHGKVLSRRQDFPR